MSEENGSLFDVTSNDWNIYHPHWKNYPQLSGIMHTFLALVGIVIFFVSFAGNAIVIMLFVRFRSLRSFSNMFVLNLTVADLVLSLGNMPMLVLASFNKGWLFGNTGCRIYAFIGSIASFVSINTLTVIAIDRCLVIVKNLPLHNQMSRRRFGIIVFFLWTYSLLWAGMPLFGFGKYILEGSETSCTFEFLSQTPIIRAHVYSIFTVHFLIPVTIIIGSYSLIFVAIYRHQREFALATRIYGETEVPLRTRKSYKGMTNEAKTARVSIIVITVFCLSWLPYAMVAIVGISGDSSSITRIVATLPCMFAKFSTVINPIIYALLHPKFRTKVNLYCLCKSETNTPNESQKQLQKRSHRMTTMSRRHSLSS